MSEWGDDLDHANDTVRRRDAEIERMRQKLEAFETVLAALDKLRFTGYQPAEFTPQWRARAEKAESELAARGVPEVTDEAVEAAARVLWSADVIELAPWDLASEDDKNWYRDVARRALEAVAGLRSPGVAEEKP